MYSCIYGGELSLHTLANLLAAASPHYPLEWDLCPVWAW